MDNNFAGGMPGGGPALTRDHVKQGKLLECECGDALFDAYTAVTKISHLVSPTGQEIELPMRVMVCRSCGKVPEWSDPDGLIPEEIRNKGQ